MQLSTQELQQSWNTGDREKDIEMVNSFLSGNVEINDTPQPETPQEEPVESHEEPPVEENTTDQGEPQPDVEEQTDFVDTHSQELEQQRAYAELLEQRRKEEHEEHLRQLQSQRDEAERERKAREELEERLRQLENLNSERPTNPDNVSAEDEEDEYASEYVKQTRRMVEELKASVGANDPAVKELKDKISEISQVYEREREATRRAEEERKQREAEERQYKSVSEFQSKFPELQTNKSIQDIEKDYFEFRRKVKDITGAKTSYDLDKKIDDYMKNGQTKEILSKYGVKPPDDFDKYNNILELVEMKRGYKYDPVLGKNVPILDDEGKPVRYRTLEEAYRIKNFDREIEKQKREAYKEVNKKLQYASNAAVELPPDTVESISTGMTAEQERMYINMNPREWINDPEKKSKVEAVYRKHGLEMPQYRGRRI